MSANVVMELSKQIAKLRAEVQDLRSSKTGTRFERPFTNRKCHVCVANKVPSCAHCFVCACAGHMARQCPRNSKTNAPLFESSQLPAQADTAALN